MKRIGIIVAGSAYPMDGGSPGHFKHSDRVRCGGRAPSATDWQPAYPGDNILVKCTFAPEIERALVLPGGTCTQAFNPKPEVRGYQASGSRPLSPFTVLDAVPASGR